MQNFVERFFEIQEGLVDSLVLLPVSLYEEPGGMDSVHHSAAFDEAALIWCDGDDLA